MPSMSHKTAFAARMVLCGLVFVAAMSLSGALVTALGLKMMAMPDGVNQQAVALASLLASPLLALALAPLAVRLPGAWVARTGWLALFLYVTFGLNTMIEARIFSSMVGPGTLAGMCVFYVLPCLTLALAVAAAFPAREPHPALLPHRPAAAWAGRLAFAWLAFPVAYLFFGTLISPLVIEQYRQGVAGLVLLPIGVIVSTQLGRSLLYLASALPLVILWSGSWRTLAVRFGWAYWVLTGLYGLITAFWMPANLRLIHSLEIGADSFAYAFLLAWALRAPSKSASRAAAQPAS
ncbi:MAG: hypothetical protein ACOYX1_07390 [Acidobacteriota bacterium]